MQIRRIREAVMLACAMACAGCGKKADTDSPLAFVPADTAFVFANIEALPDVVVARYSSQMQAAWPLLGETIDTALAEVDKADPGKGSLPLLRALFDEVRTRDTAEKWQQVGFGPHTHAAFYGIGLLPVMRVELGDADAFRAAVARVEQKTGTKLAVVRIGEQDAWSISEDAVQGFMAIVGHHLVLTAAPASADDALKRRLLGIDRPQHSLAEGSALADFNRAQGYLAYGSGWLDVKRTLALLVDAAKTSAGATPPLDAACAADFDRIAALAPRLTAGYTALDGNLTATAARIELAPDLAKALGGVFTTAPALAPTDNALMDVALSLPVVKLRDFIVAQADAVAAAPFRCSALAGLNESFAATKAKSDMTIPPPFADLTSLRISLDRIAWPAGTSVPDVDASVVVGSANPSIMLTMAQLAVPALAQLKLTPDAQAVAIPAAALPMPMPPGVELYAALGTSAIGVAIGKNETAALGARVAAAPSANAIVMQTQMSGDFYSAFGDVMQRYTATLPAQTKMAEAQRKLYALYATWFKRLGMRVAMGPDRIELTQTVEFR